MGADDVTVRRLRRAIGTLLAVGVGTVFVRGADRPPDPYLKTAPAPPGAVPTAPAPSGP